MKQLSETPIANEILKVITEKESYGWDVDFSIDAVKMMVEGMAKYLGQVKEKNKVHACIINHSKGNTFHFGAYVEYVKGDEGNNSYVLTYSFDEKIFENKDWAVVTIADPVFHHILADVGLTRYALAFRAVEGKEFISPVMSTCADCLKAYMHDNIQIDPAIELENYFRATAELDGNKIFYKFTPEEVIKQHVKDDAANENATKAAAKAAAKEAQAA